MARFGRCGLSDMSVAWSWILRRKPTSLTAQPPCEQADLQHRDRIRGGRLLTRSEACVGLRCPGDDQSAECDGGPTAEDVALARDVLLYTRSAEIAGARCPSRGEGRAQRRQLEHLFKAFYAIILKRAPHLTGSPLLLVAFFRFSMKWPIHDDITEANHRNCRERGAGG
jgi:hypothetical protein